ncbi:MAG: RNA polymerase sigma factor [Chitinophagia bacterium]|nr:RNA polymerase sigma factor [Chitinophagia bacterium]
MHLNINYQPLNESEFIQALQRGESAAYQRLLNETQDWVYNTVLGIVQNESAAEDLAQEVYIQVFRSIGNFRGDARLSTWMYRIAIQKALDWVRKQKRAQFWRNRGFGLHTNEETNFNHPGVLAEEKELAAVLFRAVKKLPEQQQIAWILIKTEGLPYSIVAEIMKTTVKSVEALMHRAKTNIKKNIQLHYK